MSEMEQNETESKAVGRGKESEGSETPIDLNLWWGLASWLYMASACMYMGGGAWECTSYLEGETFVTNNTYKERHAAQRS